MILSFLYDILSFNFNLYMLEDHIDMLDNLNDFFTYDNNKKYKIYCGFIENYNISKSFILSLIQVNEKNMKDLNFSTLYQITEYLPINIIEPNQSYKMKVKDIEDLRYVKYIYLMIYPIEKINSKIGIFIFICKSILFDHINYEQFVDGDLIYSKIFNGFN